MPNAWNAGWSLVSPMQEAREPLEQLGADRAEQRTRPQRPLRQPGSHQQREDGEEQQHVGGAAEDDREQRQLGRQSLVQAQQVEELPARSP